MAKSSINFQRAAKGGLHHNDRTEAKEPEYLLPVEHRGKNECDRSAIDAGKMIEDLYARAKENYKKQTGQSLQAKSYTWEAVINLNADHTLQDVQRLTKEIEKETGFTSVQIAIHRDEGHINERGIAERNLHAHVTFFTLDRQSGKQLYRKQATEKQKAEGIVPMDRERLSKLQDLTAATLSMERGKKGSKAVRLGHKEFKQSKQNELAKQKDLKAEIAELRSQLKEQGADRQQYAELEALNRELKAEIKAKNLTVDKLKQEIDSLSFVLEASNKAKISPKNDFDGSEVEKTEKNDLKPVSDLLNSKENEIGMYEEGSIRQKAEDSERFGSHFKLHRLIEDKGVKGERKVKGGLLSLTSTYEPTVTFDKKDLDQLKSDLAQYDKDRTKEVHKALDLYKRAISKVGKIREYVKKQLGLDKPKEQKLDRQKEVKKNQGMSR